MTTIKEADFRPEWELWEDPGDYPNGAASSPLPSRWEVTGIDGYADVEFSANEVADIHQRVLEIDEEDADFDALLYEDAVEEIDSSGVVPDWLTVKAWDLDIAEEREDGSLIARLLPGDWVADDHKAMEGEEPDWDLMADDMRSRDD